MHAIYYDTETTGTSAEKDRIIEIAAYNPITKQSFVSFINPGCPIPPETTAIHHITDEMVAAAPPFSQVIQEFIRFCEGDVILIAHNNDAFDWPFIKAEMTRNQIQPPPWKFFDSLKWARRYRPDLPRHSLQFLREIYGIVANQAHRALDDVLILEQVVSLMLDDLTIKDAYGLLNQKRHLQHMPFGKHQGVPLKNVPKDYLTWLFNNGAFDKAENQELRASLEALGMLKT